MTCTFANTEVPQVRTINLVDTTDDIDVGDRTIIITPGSNLPWKIEATKKAGRSLCSIGDVVITDVGTPTGELAIDNSDVQGGSLLLQINGEEAVDGDDWIVTCTIHPTSEQNIPATIYVSARTP